ncbi:MAG: DUF370 domain-containing protein [Eubacteriales bacterium]|nr:DUF370 domain-containing protein [Eubacteriales bacterium]
MKLVDIGFGNTVNAARVVSVVSPESLPVRRLIQDAKNVNRVIDVSCGKKTKAVIITDSEHFILSAEEVKAIAERMNSKDE